MDFHAKVDFHTNTRRNESLKQLYQQVESYRSVFLSPEDLQALGIQASQVDITEDGALQFNPCLFRPHPERVLEKYPLDPLKKTSYITPLNYRPDWDTILERIKEGSPGIKYEDAAECATKECKTLSDLGAGNWYLQADRTHRHIDDQIGAKPRKGRPGSLSFFDLGSPRMYWR